MDTVLNFITENIVHAHWIIAGLIFLAGLNVPMSLDVLLIVAGAIAAIFHEEGFWHLYIWCLVASWLAAWESYWLGRIFGPKLYNVWGVRHVLSKEKVERLHHYYEKFGIFTFIVGRFIPGGIRNALFMTSGLGKMPFNIFVFRDMIAATIQVTAIFGLGYWFGENYREVIRFFQTYNLIIFSIIIAVLLLICFQIRRQRKKS